MARRHLLLGINVLKLLHKSNGLGNTSTVTGRTISRPALREKRIGNLAEDRELTLVE